jgi:hypothetical protein
LPNPRCEICCYEVRNQPKTALSAPESVSRGRASTATPAPLAGWARFRLYFLVMLVKIPLRALPKAATKRHRPVREFVAADRIIDLALGSNGAVNSVAMKLYVARGEGFKDVSNVNSYALEQ